MDVQTGIQLDSNGEFDAWMYVPQGSISVSNTFDWALPDLVPSRRVLEWTAVHVMQY